MALNKSTRNTPSSRSGYFSESTASAEKQTNFLLPVRIKVTPNNTSGPLSDGKKNPVKLSQPVLIKDLLKSTQKSRPNTTLNSGVKLSQPVLIKDLLQSTQKSRPNTTLTSVSTQKKRVRSKTTAQSFLNTQSCYKPKKDEAESSTSFIRKSYGENKVRRQIYQNLDYLQNECADDPTANTLVTNSDIKSTTSSTGVRKSARRSLAKAMSSDPFPRLFEPRPIFKPVLVKTLLDDESDGDSDEQAASGKQTNFVRPVRIKVTPNNTVGSLSDGKKNPVKLSQPVLIKDLLQSTQKSRPNTKLTSVSTQKKRAGSKKSAQSFLNTKKDKTEPSTFFSRKSYGENKVRRQIYQNLDSPQKSSVEDKSVGTKKSNQITFKNRKSLLLPPNSIKNSFLRKSISNLKPISKPSVRTIATATNKSNKAVSRLTETKKLKSNVKKNVTVEEEEEVDIELHLSSPEIDEHETKQSSYSTKDNFTMTSPTIDCRLQYSDNLSNKIEMNNLDYNNFIKLKSFLEQSIQVTEDQTFKLKQMLNFINNMYEDSTAKIKSTQFQDQFRTEEKNTSIINMSSQNSSIIADDICEKSVKNKNSFSIEKSFGTYQAEVKTEEKSPTDVSQKIPISIRTIVTDADLNQEAKDKDNSENMERVSDLSRTVSEWSKVENDGLENKENMNDFSRTMTVSPFTPKRSRRRSLAPGSCDSQVRRRSARLAAKQASLSALSDSDKQDSFTMLEKELNVVHPVPSKSLPASPMMKPPMTPGIVKQWDKKMERPLKEYMALKVNGTFLVTPDVKKFQSRLEPTDTPHSRKSLSRKIFMELCDLYAESPEHK